MAIKYPLEYELTPKSIATGRHWVTLSLQNIGAQDLTGLDASLNSLDAYSISVLGTGSYISILSPNERRELPFQVSANRTGSLYVTVDGWQDGERFHWESPGIPVTVGAEVAELVSLFAIDGAVFSRGREGALRGYDTGIESERRAKARVLG